MAEFLSGVPGPVLFLLGVLAWAAIILGSCWLAVLVYCLRELWKQM